jgi:hypothetical protein
MIFHHGDFIPEFAKVWTIQLIASDGETLGGPARFLSLEEESSHSMDLRIKHGWEIPYQWRFIAGKMVVFMQVIFFEFAMETE